MISKITRSTEAVVLLFLILLCPASSYAQSTKQQIEELKKQIEIIQLQNQKQIDELKKQLESLQTERAADKEKVTELIAAEKEQDKEAWYKNFLGKYDKGFVFESSDDKGFEFKTRFTMLAQIQGIVNDTDEKLVSTNFNIRRFELRWDGYAFVPWFYYTLMIDPAASTLLKDAYLTAAYQDRKSVV